jgi:hypothetical protein
MLWNIRLCGMTAHFRHLSFSKRKVSYHILTVIKDANEQILKTGVGM